MIACDYPRVLVSSYDISTYTPDSDPILRRLRTHFRRGSFVILDSGVFESFWRRDASWNLSKYSRIVAKIDCDFYVGYDSIGRKDGSISQSLNAAIKQISACSGLSKNGDLLPVVHGFKPTSIVQTVKRLSTQIQKSTRTLAVAERECGASLIERASTILQLRRVLNSVDDGIILHVLGCGNPISLALYVYCGADTFDSLDWTKITIDRNDLTVFDFSQLDLLDCKCKACSKKIDGAYERTLLHNLLFYQDFGLQLQRMIRRDTLWDFLVEYVGLKNLNKLGD